MVQEGKDASRWLAEARSGSREALGRMLDTCRNYLLLVARQQLGTDVQAKGDPADLVQDTFLEAQRDFAQFQGTTQEELLAWLRRLLLNNVGNFTRRYRDTGKRDVGREVALEADSSSSALDLGLAADTPSPSSAALKREQAEALRRCLERLPDDYYQIIVFRYLEGRSFEEIGRLLDRSPDAARKLWTRALRRLRQEWKGPS